jgi:hypothetical protein
MDFDGGNRAYLQPAKQNFCQKYDPSKSGFGILNEKRAKIVAFL